MSWLGLGLGIDQPSEGGASSPFAAYALAMPFSTQPTDKYWISGTSYNTVNLLPGYSFTRTGQQGAVDASGAVQYFAANVPAINSKGYSAYGALTNFMVRSQAFDNASWNKLNSTVTADAALAPDGTTTMDKIVEDTATNTHLTYQTVGGMTANTLTFSVFVKQGTQRYISMRGGNNVGPSYPWLTIDTQTGAVAINGAVTAGYAVNCGGGIWRAVMVYTWDVSNADFCIGLSNVSTAPATGSVLGNSYLGASLDAYIWQAQIIVGNFPDGGPIIVTAAATASIGASALNVSLGNATYSAAVYTFDDTSTQSSPLTIADGALNLPTDFVPNRPIAAKLLVSV